MVRSLMGFACLIVLSWPALAAGPRLPASAADTAREGVCEVEVTSDGVRLLGQPVVPLREWKPESEPGLWSGTMLLEPLRDALASWRTRLEGLCLAVDRDAPYGLLVRVLYTAGQAEHHRIRFAVLSADGQPRALDIALPRLASGSDDDPTVRLTHAADKAPPPLHLTLAVTRNGLALFGEGGKPLPERPQAKAGGLATAPILGPLDRPGCKQEKVPTAGCMDLARLRSTLWEIKVARTTETRIILVAVPELRFADLVALMDAVRGAPERPLFPDVLLSAGIQ